MITYSDICDAYRLSLKKIEQDENNLKEELLRFQNAFIADLYMPVPDYKEQVYENTGKIDDARKKPRVEFIPVSTNTDSTESLNNMALKYHFDILIHIGMDPLSSEVSATFRKRVILQQSIDAFFYFVDFRQFIVKKNTEAERYDPLFYYIKASFYKLCSYSESLK